MARVKEIRQGRKKRVVNGMIHTQISLENDELIPSAAGTAEGRQSLAVSPPQELPWLKRDASSQNTLFPEQTTTND